MVYIYIIPWGKISKSPTTSQEKIIASANNSESFELVAPGT